MEVSYYFEYKTIHNIYNPTLYDIKELKIIIDYLYNQNELVKWYKNKNNKTTTITTKGSARINSENGITTVTINE